MSSKKFENSILIIIGIIVGKAWLYLLRIFEFSSFFKILLLTMITITLYIIYRQITKLKKIKN